MESFDQLIHSEKPVLVDFYADWCGPCKAMSPVIQEVAKAVAGQGEGNKSGYRQKCTGIPGLPGAGGTDIYHF